MTTLIERIKIFHHLNPWKARFTAAFIILALILIIVRISLTPAIIYGATSWLKKQGIDASIETINISILDGNVSLINAKGSKDTQPLFNIGRVEIYWQWTPLSEKTIEVTKVVLDQFNVDIQQYTDHIIIGGVNIPLNVAAGKEAPIVKDSSEEVTPWAAQLGEVVFSNLNICYLQHASTLAESNNSNRQFDYCVDLNEMQWGGYISYATDKRLLQIGDVPLSSHGDFILNGLNIIDNKLNKNLLSSVSNRLNNVVISGLNNISIDTLEMNELSALQRDDTKHIDSVRFRQLAIADIKLSDLNALQIGSITVSQPGLYLVKNNNKSWEYEQWLPTAASNTTAPATTKTETSAEKTATTFKLAVNDVTINSSDFCYLEKQTSLYYCFTLEKFGWDGTLTYDSATGGNSEINLAAAGNLSLTHPNVHNHTIDRHLLDFKTLAINNIKLTDGTNIQFENLTLENLAALQRSSKADDHTAQFSKLAINSLNYADNQLVINTINLDGLTSTVSKNKDGKWEHDKWLVKNDKKEKSASDTDSSKSSDTKPLQISLNDLRINSEKPISFIDNSTEPVMNIGLQELVFEISKLAASKPDTDSPFKLHANTTRHSTVDLEGTVRPFAEKVSFKADGKLKGFDLRAATPATQKAIGHIIKSGQMDADLKLTATEGILDSNIGLSLYHFNIKPMSKADAEKLDNKFGMPLNQTLVLLRDKDDSIHLDIPITGDINNPEFNPMDAIVKATSKAATVTLVTFYTPYGLIYAGGNVLFDLATAMNFDPVQFDAGTFELREKNKEQLDNLAKLLTEKPQIHLTLCGVTNSADVSKLFPELQKNKNGDKTTLSEKQATVLSELAHNRQTAVKNYLIKESSVAHDRLILCAPEHKADKDAVAGVEINI